MPLNPAFAGRVYPATAPYLVGREKIREFAAAIGDTSCDTDDDPAAPPTFAIALTLRAEVEVVSDPELGLDLTRLLHREQRFEHRRPITDGDELTVTVTISEVGRVGGTDMVTLTSELHTVAGEHVCTTTSTLIAQGDD
ncbi:FAS1-like dehydratase domain-containing protein [Streptosporangium saharense]|uniref:Acyl dehydratase n=1 Tax=Streptosporangium saharense TaxID=1706840 RepID=A0A7W7VQH3_9ACTN|nr:MaoC family dehydratase N-terminal domain-containing protein [Streptosporangium saharense]MBB4918524.1 acyl dehydratase [Streptosporangium saharense]